MGSDFEWEPITDDEIHSLVDHEYKNDARGYVAEAENILAQAAPGAARQIVALSANAVNERIRFSASQYILERVGVYSVEGSKGGTPVDGILAAVLREPSKEELEGSGG